MIPLNWNDTIIIIPIAVLGRYVDLLNNIIVPLMLN